MQLIRWKERKIVLKEGKKNRGKWNRRKGVGHEIEIKITLEIHTFIWCKFFKVHTLNFNLTHMFYYLHKVKVFVFRFEDKKKNYWVEILF